MKCPKCGRNNFYELDCDSVDDGGQCKGSFCVPPQGCGYTESCNYVRGYWDGLKKAKPE